MKRKLEILFFILFVYSKVFAQSKDYTVQKTALIEKILSINVLDDGEWIWAWPVENSEFTQIPNNYLNLRNFEKLCSYLSEDEILKLSFSDSAILRMYALGYWLDKKPEKINFANTFRNEIKRNNLLKTRRSCDRDERYTYTILYNMVDEKFSVNNSFKNNDSLLYRSILDSFNEIILSSNSDLDHYIFYRAFHSTPKQNFEIDKTIQLFLKFNNTSALYYLFNNHPLIYQKTFKTYISEILPNQKFTSKNQLFYFFELVYFSLEKRDKEALEILRVKMNELKKKDYYFDLFKNRLLDDSVNGLQNYDYFFPEERSKEQLREKILKFKITDAELSFLYTYKKEVYYNKKDFPEDQLDSSIIKAWAFLFSDFEGSSWDNKNTEFLKAFEIIKKHAQKISILSNELSDL